MSACERRGGRVFAGLLILMGTLLFLENVGLLPYWTIKDFWPVWLIVWGVFILDRSDHRIAWIWAFALIVIGVLLILGNTHVLHVNAGVIFPVMLIGLGSALILAPDELRAFGERMRERHQQRQQEMRAHRAERMEQWRTRRAEHREQIWAHRDDMRERVRERIKERINDRMERAKSYYGNSLHEDVVFSSINRRLETQQFEGGRVTAVFGSIELDLSSASIAVPAATVRLKADAVFGGIDLVVPRTWKVEMRSTAVFGGCDDRTVPPRPELGIQPPTLVVAGSAVFGGITVRN